MWGSEDEEDDDDDEEEEGKQRQPEERGLLERVRIPRASFSSSPTHNSTGKENPQRERGRRAGG